MNQSITDVEPKHKETPLPAWLVPDWLTAPVPALTHEQALLELKLVQYPIVFERILEGIAGGGNLNTLLAEDIREFERGAFLRWMNKDSERRLRFKDAKQLRAEVFAGEIIEIADAVDNPLEDVARSKLRIDSRKYVMGADYNEVYGDKIVQQIEGADGGPIKIAMAVFTPAQLLDYAVKKLEVK
jgi:hypothetical protein